MNIAKERATEASESTGPSTRSALAVVFLVVFINLLGFGIVLPLLPLMGEQLVMPLIPGAEREPIRGVVLGLLMSSFSAMQFVFAPVWGRISDRIGRRPILLLGLAGSVVFYTLFGIASEFGAGGWVVAGLVLMFIARLGAGVAGATISTAQAVIADCTSAENRARGMALIGAAFGIGFTFGPLLGYCSLLVPVSGAPGFLAAAISLVALLLGVFRLPETRSASSGYVRRRIFDGRAFFHAISLPSVGPLIFTFFLATVAFGGLESTLAYVNQSLLVGDIETAAENSSTTNKTTERTNFLVFAYVGMVLLIVQGFIYRRLVRRVGELRFMRIGVILMMVGIAGAATVLLLRDEILDRQTIFGMALLVMTVAVTGFAFVTPSVQALISRRSDPATQGEILGVNQSAAALARILGPLLGVSLFALTPSHVLPFVGGALLLAFVFLITLRIPAKYELDGSKQAT